MAWDLILWLIVFCINIALLASTLYQIICLSDLESDYLNPYESSSRINALILPEYLVQAGLCALFLLTWHWFMFLLTLPPTYYNFMLTICFLGLFMGEKINMKKYTYKAGWIDKHAVLLIVFFAALSYFPFPRATWSAVSTSFGFLACYMICGRSIISNEVIENCLYHVFFIHGCIRKKLGATIMKKFGKANLRYTKKQHLVDVTEIFRTLNGEKKYRIVKLVFYALLFCIITVRLVISAFNSLVDEEDAVHIF